jgi:hypothetical protein
MVRQRSVYSPAGSPGSSAAQWTLHSHRGQESGRPVAIERKRAALEEPLQALIAPFHKKLYDERVAMLPAEVQAIIRKPEKQRSSQEQKIADDYYPVLRIDADKLLAILPAAERKRYQELQRQLSQLPGTRRGSTIAAFWTVEMDAKKAQEKSYILTSGDAARPEKEKPVEPGWPFAPAKIDFREGRIEAFADWLTDAANPLFARVAINRLWQWHFGAGLQSTPSDFGNLAGPPPQRELLDWLADEFVKSGFRMKTMYRLIVASQAYQRASAVDPGHAAANQKLDPSNQYLWHFPLRRLDAESLWDSIFTAAGTLDLSVGGPSFDIRPAQSRRRLQGGAGTAESRNRRAAYMVRGYSTSRDVVPHFLQAFDVEDGRAPCPLQSLPLWPGFPTLLSPPDRRRLSGRCLGRNVGGSRRDRRCPPRAALPAAGQVGDLPVHVRRRQSSGHRGGVKGGTVHGATDEVGYKAEQDRHYYSDLHATILRQLGLDYKKMTIGVLGRTMKLVEEGQGPIEAILS